MRDAFREKRKFFVFPALVLAILVVLTALGISGTSSPLLAQNAGSGDSVLVGSPRSIRSDEWIVHTPMVISQVENGEPRFGDIGVGSHDMSVLSDLPVADLLTAFHPNQWAYYVFPIDNAYAFDWWSVSALLLIGTYLFLLIVVGSLRWAIVGAVFLYGSPFFHWWYTSMVFASIGWMTLGAACFLLAVASSGRRRILLAALTAYPLVCFALLIYPPWQIAAAIGVGAVTVGSLWVAWRKGVCDFRKVLTTGLLSGALAVIPILWFLTTRRPALDAISNTVYPGARVVAGGTLPWGQLFSGWFGLNYVTNGAGIRGVLFPNESEASSFLFLGVALLIALPLVWRYLAPIGDRLRAVAIATITVMILFLTQMLVGLPSIVAKLILLSTVPERRALIGLGFASMVLVVVVGSSLERLSVPKRARAVAGCVLVAVSSAGVFGLSQDFRSVDAAIGTRLTGVALLMAAGTAAIFFWRPFVAVCLLALFGLSISLSVNPLVRNLSQTRGSDVVTAVKAAEAASGGTGAWVGETYPVASLLTTAGVRNLSGVNLYPNVPAWSIIDPGRRFENVWNRYAQAVWSFDSDRAELDMTLVQADMIEVRISPCDPILDRFAVGHIITPRRLQAGCLGPAEEVLGPDSVPMFIYQRFPVGTGVADGWTVR